MARLRQYIRTAHTASLRAKSTLRRSIWWGFEKWLGRMCTGRGPVCAATSEVERKKRFKYSVRYLFHNGKASIDLLLSTRFVFFWKMIAEVKKNCEIGESYIRGNSFSHVILWFVALLITKMQRYTFSTLKLRGVEFNFFSTRSCTSLLWNDFPPQFESWVTLMRVSSKMCTYFF